MTFEDTETPLSSFEAYWINPEGEITGVPEKHILRVLREPEYFGYTREEILERFKKFREKLGWEGKAREEIFKELFPKGWIRVRKNRHNNCTVSIQTGKYGEKEKESIKKLAEMMLQNPENTQYSVLITTMAEERIETSLIDLAANKN
ncbi:MAG: hypothetical protein RBS89_07245 [Candidatus Delongbacteria bacterium]|jgi:hypothetical protein|nr:hypothetical protein [Candidatus Delongbacteria bacterium]